MTRKVRLVAWASLAVGGAFASVVGIDHILFVRSDQADRDRLHAEALHLRDEVLKLQAESRRRCLENLDLTLAAGRLRVRAEAAEREATALRTARGVEVFPVRGFAADVPPADRIPPQNVPVRPAGEE